MATEFIQGAVTVTRPAGADLTAQQNHFVKMDTSGNVIPIAAATDSPYGLLLNAPLSGLAAHVGKSGILKVVAGGTVAIGDVVGTSATGTAVKLTLGTDTTKFVVGRAATGAASGQIVQIELDCMIPRTA